MKWHEQQKQKGETVECYCFFSISLIKYHYKLLNLPYVIISFQVHNNLRLRVNIILVTIAPLLKHSFIAASRRSCHLYPSRSAVMVKISASLDFFPFRVFDSLRVQILKAICIFETILFGRPVLFVDRDSHFLRTNFSMYK